jgi:hypothetical protein
MVARWSTGALFRNVDFSVDGAPLNAVDASRIKQLRETAATG